MHYNKQMIWSGMAALLISGSATVFGADDQGAGNRALSLIQKRHLLNTAVHTGERYLDDTMRYHSIGPNDTTLDEEGTTVLMAVCSYGERRDAEWLIEIGANVNSLDALGQNALHRTLSAAADGYESYERIVELLIKSKVNLLAVDFLGQIPATLAIERYLKLDIVVSVLKATRLAAHQAGDERNRIMSREDNEGNTLLSRALKPCEHKTDYYNDRLIASVMLYGGASHHKDSLRAFGQQIAHTQRANIPFKLAKEALRSKGFNTSGIDTVQALKDCRNIQKGIESANGDRSIVNDQRFEEITRVLASHGITSVKESDLFNFGCNIARNGDQSIVLKVLKAGKKNPDIKRSYWLSYLACIQDGVVHAQGAPQESGSSCVVS